ncbi:DUF6153 family protein [Streptomyces sp. NPDC018610]|uniref:DUF6153 family protein n=1 Tax=Streptomyces sp. NPDC018610 TaxID=3365049 RepID=UPI003788E26A
MTSGARTRFAVSRAGRTLLVLAVLAGVFAMHALSPAGMPASGEHGALTTLTASGHRAMTALAASGHRDMTAGPSLGHGVLAMTAPAGSGHGAAPAAAGRGAVPAVSGHDAATAYAPVRGHRPVPARAGGVLPPPTRVCPPSFDASGCGGTAMAHAGGTCAAAGVSVSYTPPAPLPAPGRTATPPVGARTGPAAGPSGGRAPPDLAELQLLRI